MLKVNYQPSMFIFIKQQSQVEQWTHIFITHFTINLSTINVWLSIYCFEKTAALTIKQTKQ